MYPIANRTLMIDTGSSVHNDIAADLGSGVNDASRHENRALPYAGVLRNDGRRMNQVRKRKAVRECLLGTSYSATAISKGNNGVGHALA